MTFKKTNRLIGWLLFSTAFITYLLTLEPTVSLWDCGEFLASSYKLEPGHPPGAPLFLLMARFFSLFAMGNISMVAYCINAMSAMASALTVMFLYWSVVLLASKFKSTNSNDFSISHRILIIGSGIVGALSLAFSDSFWFSAVEAEVYAFSSLLTAMVFWAILKWESANENPYTNRWLLLIAFLMGLSIGVHLLNLLAIPAIVLIIYFKNYKTTAKGLLLVLLTSVLLLLFMMYGVIQGLITIAWWFELMLINRFALPFNTGVVAFLVLLIFSISYGIYYTYVSRKYLFNTLILAFALVVLGYSSYTVIVIRANADTPINEGKPDNILSLLSYLNRDQYGNSPLIYGQSYNAPIVGSKEGKANYIKSNKGYLLVSHNLVPVYDNRFTGFFPRMYSSDPNHISIYKDWGQIKGTKIEILNSDGSSKTMTAPTLWENIRFFFSYQVGHMYVRYFMWNFAGRQNDIQGHGGFMRGNWLSGFDIIDNVRLSTQETLPNHIKNNPSRNRYFFLPLLIGLAGIFFQYFRNRKDFWVVLTLFIMTGLAIVVYLNQTPLQPRERDYAYVGSFYAFCIWIGIGVLAIGYRLIEITKRYHKTISYGVVAASMIVPGLMFAQNFDDHNRSGRFHTWNYAYNYLAGCELNAILFTYGDNDTFPLWYMQEVEGFRTDVRVVNTSLLNLDWYIDQMKKKTYLSDSLPISLSKQKYSNGKRDRVYVFDKSSTPIDLQNAIDFVTSDDPQTKSVDGYNKAMNHFRSKKMYLLTDTSQNLFNNDTLQQINFSIRRNSIGKSELIILDILAHNNWKRPIYFVEPIVPGTKGFENFLQLEGLSYRLVKNKCDSSKANVNTSLMYSNLMYLYNWKSMGDSSVYVDNFHERNMLMLRLKQKFTLLAKALLTEGKRDSALAVLNKCEQICMRGFKKDDKYSPALAEAFYIAGDTTNANKIIKRYYNTCNSELVYYFSLSTPLRNRVDYDLSNNLNTLKEMEKITLKYTQHKLSEEIKSSYDKYFNIYLSTK